MRGHPRSVGLNRGRRLLQQHRMRDNVGETLVGRQAARAFQRLVIIFRSCRPLTRVCRKLKSVGILALAGVFRGRKERIRHARFRVVCLHLMGRISNHGHRYRALPGHALTGLLLQPGRGVAAGFQRRKVQDVGEGAVRFRVGLAAVLFDEGPHVFDRGVVGDSVQTGRSRLFQFQMSLDAQL